jgi:hypothetical protein
MHPIAAISKYQTCIFFFFLKKNVLFFMLPPGSPEATLEAFLPLLQKLPLRHPLHPAAFLLIFLTQDFLSPSREIQSP